MNFNNEMINYPIERIKFSLLFDSYFVDNEDNLESKFFELILDGAETDSFKMWYNFEDEEVYILHKTSGILVNWYKLYHVGRCLTCNKKLTYHDFETFFTLLKSEIVEMEVNKNEY